MPWAFSCVFFFLLSELLGSICWYFSYLLTLESFMGSNFIFIRLFILSYREVKFGLFLFVCFFFSISFFYLLRLVSIVISRSLIFSLAVYNLFFSIFRNIFISNIVFFSSSCLSLAELLPGEKRKSFFFLMDWAIIIGHESFPFWPPDPILFEVSVY